MARFQNFRTWQGKWPHWRADGERYYVHFKHKRELDEIEGHALFTSLLRLNGKHVDIELLVVAPGESSLFLVPQTTGRKDFAHHIEKAKAKAAKAILAKSGERFPPYGSECYDRIIRDDAEYELLWEQAWSAVPEEERGTDWPNSYMRGSF